MGCVAVARLTPQEIELSAQSLYWVNVAQPKFTNKESQKHHYSWNITAGKY